jgi:segregation and condensation protein B
MELKAILEAVLFAAQKPLTPRELRDVLAATAAQSADPSVKAFKKIREPEIQAVLEALERDHAAAGRSYRLACVAGAWQFVSQPEFAPWLMTLLGQKPRPPRLSQPGLETLAIIAYRQPVTRAEIEQVRGVAVDGVMQTLLERGLVEQTGRAEYAGRPLMYGTTALFLEYFGLRALQDLPAADELRRIPVKKPEALLTVDADGSQAAEPAPPGEGELFAAAAQAEGAPAGAGAGEPAAEPETPAVSGASETKPASASSQEEAGEPTVT